MKLKGEVSNEWISRRTFTPIYECVRLGVAPCHLARGSGYNYIGWSAVRAKWLHRSHSLRTCVKCDVIDAYLVCQHHVEDLVVIARGCSLFAIHFTGGAIRIVSCNSGASRAKRKCYSRSGDSQSTDDISECLREYRISTFFGSFETADC